MQVNKAKFGTATRAITVLAFITMLGLLLVWTSIGYKPAAPIVTQNIPAVLPIPMQTVQPTVTVMEATLTVGPPQASPYPSLTPVAPDAVLERDYGTWRFKAIKHPEKGLAAEVRYDQSSVDSLNAYVAANKQLAKELAGEGKEFDVTITFRNFVEPDKFRSWVTTQGIHVTDADVRAIDGAGNQIVVFVSPQSGDSPLPQEILDKAVSPNEQVGIGSSGTIVGVYFMRAKVDASRLSTIADDPLVYLVDVTPVIVRNELIAAGWTGMDKSFIHVEPSHPFFNMEEIGIWKFSP